MTGPRPNELIGPATDESAPTVRRADEALPVAALATGAEVTPVDEAAAPADGVGALLRHR
ncbi:hypothetical protein OH799_04600 [Nocardia sp. NBC_00881]|uniref:hypothetical protein n=1 Tax=Nocardia sp. NBC_00881 TaxID=2975995 RepID=UPI00386E9C0F|nr:hypothetical protein OH799_04600 [Nocardia sp. NBC_00881]